MRGLAETQHHVVRDVDDVRDRPHAGRGDARLQPGRRGADVDVGEHATGPPGAEVGRLDAYADVILGPAVAGRIRLGAGPWRESGVEHRRHLAGDPVHAQAVRPVGRDLEFHHRLGDRQHVGQRGAGLELAGQQHDALVILGQLELVLGEDHAVRLDTAQLRPLQLHAAG
jgi:hypothetical protein